MDEQLEANIRLRGSVIERAVIMERGIDLVIASHFTDNVEKQNELIDIVFGSDRMTLYSKYQILEYLLKAKTNNWKSSYEKRMMGIVRNVMEFRNIIAHQLILNNCDIPAGKDAKGSSYVLNVLKFQIKGH